MDNEESSDKDAVRNDPDAAEAARLVPDALWHYTDAAGLLGILGGSAASTSPPGATFWATGLEYLNDHQELVFGLKHVRAALENFTEELQSGAYAPHNVVNIEGKVAFLERLRDAITDVIERTYPYPIHCYVTSFSTENDLLSQWRGYGSGLDGYAIGVDPSGLTDERGHPLRPAGRFAPVYYGDHAVPPALTDDVLTRLCPFLCRLDAPPTSPQMINQQLRWIATLAAQVKHEGFKEEGEWRYIDPGYFDGASYRSRGTRLIPYTSWSVPPERVIGVKVGPSANQRESAKAVTGLLNSNGFYRAAENVTASNIPFRS